jgi:hypothetical protein
MDRFKVDFDILQYFIPRTTNIDQYGVVCITHYFAI